MSEHELILPIKESDFPKKSKKIPKKSNKSNIDNLNNDLLEVFSKFPSAEEHEVDYNSAVTESKYHDITNITELNNKIAIEFNNGRKTIMTKSPLGKRIDPDQFRLVAFNKQVELVPPSSNKYRKQIYLDPATEIEEIGIFDQTNLCVGAYGTFLLNVPVGKILAAKLGNIPVLFGQGYHVVHNPNLNKIKKDNLLSVDDSYIHHENYHIIRVPPGTIACVAINNKPYFLTPRQEPYVFRENVFEWKQEFVSLTQSIISHKTYHIIQVPKGKIAKVWVGSEPRLLEYQVQPYVIDDPSFRIEKKNNGEYFEEATEKIIIHGSIKRIIPETGEVAVTYNNGKLEILVSNGDKPHFITSPNHKFTTFLQTNIQTIQFPTEQTRQLRKKQMKESNKTSSSKDDMTMNDVNYETFRTSDGLPIGVNLLVVFKIIDPEATLKELSPSAIIPHIEGIVVADMGMVIQACKSNDFLKTGQTQIQPATKDLLTEGSGKDFFELLQDKIKKKLHEDFQKYGIELARLNVETPKVLDTTISDKMAQFSLMNSEAAAQEAMLEKSANISKQKAYQEAQTKQIALEQENLAKISKAKAEFESAKLISDAKRIEYEVENNNEAAKLKLAEERAKIYDKSPGLLQFHTAELQTKAMQGIQTSIISSDVASAWYYPMFPMHNMVEKKSPNKI